MSGEASEELFMEEVFSPVVGVMNPPEKEEDETVRGYISETRQRIIKLAGAFRNVLFKVQIGTIHLGSSKLTSADRCIIKWVHGRRIFLVRWRRRQF